CASGAANSTTRNSCGWPRIGSPASTPPSPVPPSPTNPTARISKPHLSPSARPSTLAAPHDHPRPPRRPQPLRRGRGSDREASGRPDRLPRRLLRQLRRHPGDGGGDGGVAEGLSRQAGPASPLGQPRPLAPLSPEPADL